MRLADERDTVKERVCDMVTLEEAVVSDSVSVSDCEKVNVLEIEEAEGVFETLREGVRERESVSVAEALREADETDSEAVNDSDERDSEALVNVKVCDALRVGVSDLVPESVTVTDTVVRVSEIERVGDAEGDGDCDVCERVREDAVMDTDRDADVTLLDTDVRVSEGDSDLEMVREGEGVVRDAVTDDRLTVPESVFESVTLSEAVVRDVDLVRLTDHVSVSDRLVCVSVRVDAVTVKLSVNDDGALTDAVVMDRVSVCDSVGVVETEAVVSVCVFDVGRDGDRVGV